MTTPLVSFSFQSTRSAFFLQHSPMVSRAAFYRYYQDKYDLAEQLFEETMHALVNNFDPLRRELLHSSAPEPTLEFWAKLLDQLAHSISPLEAWVRLFEHVAEHERLYRALLDQKRSSWFVTKMRTYLPCRSERPQRFPDLDAQDQQWRETLIVPRVVVQIGRI